MMRQQRNYITLDDAIRKVADYNYDPEILDVFVNYYKEKGISHEVIDLLLNYELIRLVACGLSNKTISKYLEIPIEEVQYICERFFSGFTGWEIDLDYNPLFLDGTLSEDVQKIVDDFKIHREILDEVWE